MKPAAFIFRGLQFDALFEIINKKVLQNRTRKKFTHKMLLFAQGSSRQVARSILSRSLYDISKSLSNSVENFWHFASIRQIQNAARDASTTRDAIYVYDTSGHSGFESDAVTLGLLNSLAKLKPGLGLFCPVDRCMRRGYRSEMFKKIMMLHGYDVAVTKGVTMDRAYQLMASDRKDELLSEILEAYMTFRENHDFVVLEGTYLKGPEDGALNLNVDIAYTLNTASLLVANAKRSFNLNDRSVELEKSDWKKTLLDNIKVNEIAFKHNHVDVMGALVYNLPGKTKYNNSLQNLFEDRKIACFGVIPEDSFLQSCQNQNSNCMLPVLATPCTSIKRSSALENLCSEISSDIPRKILQALILLSDNINSNMLEKSLQKVQSKLTNPKIFQYNLFAQAKREKQHIVLPEGEESRTIQAAASLLKKKLCNLTLLGDPEKINELASQFEVDLKCAHIINPLESPLRDKYATMLYEYRKAKGITKDEAYDLAKDVTYFGTLKVAAGDADGMVSGAIHTTADTIRPALQIIKTEPGIIASSVIFICLKDKVLVFADCAVNVEPTSKELAGIAVASAETAMAFGIKPLVAMLSYATGDSNEGPLVQKVRDAKNIALELQPNLCVEGPLQYDAAVNLTAAKVKLKGQESTVAGKANILVFPELNSGNIAYKAVQQSTGAIGMGPLLQGLRKPINDLSRGCTVDDIISTVVMTALQAAYQKKKHTSVK